MITGVFDMSETPGLNSLVHTYILPFLLNQCGSVLYFLTLQSAQLSLAVPVTNSLTFVFTALSGWFLGEKLIDKNTLYGMMLVVCGTALCCLDKALEAEVKTERTEF